MCAVPVLAWKSWKSFEREHWLSLVPPQFEVDSIVYAESEAWGFGPGGNETGVVVYELPTEVSSAVRHGGLRHVEALANQLTWKETPLKGHKEWFEGEGALPQTGPVRIPRLYNYLNRYGFGISIEAKYMAEIDKAVSEAGSFYAYSRTGVLIVMPSRTRIAFVYAG